MKALIILPLLLVLVSQGQNTTPSADGSSIAVLGSRWAKHRQTVTNPTTDARVAPAQSAMLPSNRILERNRRVNDQAGQRDPNADTVDGRAAALEKSVEDARSPKSKTMDGFLYQVKVKNEGAKVVEVMFWEYQFRERSNPANVVIRQFLCGVNIKPGKEKELSAFTIHGPSNLISVESLGNKPGNLFDEKILINRVEYADGSIWQRKDWNVAEVKSSIQRALSSPWGQEMCRGL